MTCGRARRLLWPDAGPRDATADVVAAREHAAGCEECRRFLEDTRRLADWIGRCAPRPTAPPGVRDRLFRTIAQVRAAAPTPHRGRRLYQMAFAGIAALLVVGLSLLGYLSLRDDFSDRRDALASIVDDRLRSQQGPGIASSDSGQVAQWLAERLTFAVQVPIFPEARLTGARLLVDNHQAGAVVEYLVQGRGLTYYVLPGRSAGSQREIQLTSRDGYRVARWHDGGLTHALVATLPGTKLVELARYCIHQMIA
jgi:anti-sigma factor RsiW